MNEPLTDEIISEERRLKFSPRWGRIILIAMIAVAAWAAYFAYNNNTYHHYEVQSKTRRPSSENTSYLSLEGKLFSYSRDGASLSNYSGGMIWNESFDMDNPASDSCGSYILIYDKESTSAYIFNSSGTQGTLSMTMPIIRAAVASNGDVAVLMQRSDTAYIRLYNTEGDTLASGEVHAKNTGYPVAMDISSDAKKLLVSLLDLNDGDVKTTLCFYDFSDASNDDNNHIAANYSYADQVIPDVAFLKGGAVAFGDEELIFFSIGEEIEIKNEVFLQEEVKAVFHSDDRAAVVVEKEIKGGKNQKRLYVYNAAGTECFSRKVPGSMTSAGFLSNGEILIHNGENIRIYRDDGAPKFLGHARDTVRTVFPWDGQKNYYFITRDQSQKVVLR